MLNEILPWLAENEPLISSFVGLITLIAGCWGILQLLLHHRTQPTQKVDNDVISESLNNPPQNSSIWSTFINLGLTQQSELEDLISIRTINIALLSLLIINLSWVITSLFSRETLHLTIVNGTVFVGAVCIYVMQLNGRTQLARWMFFLLTASYWGVTLVLIGPMRNVEYFLPLLLVLPILLFSRNQVRELVIAIGILLLTFAIAAFLQTVITPMTKFDSVPMLDNVAYYLNLTLLSISIFSLVNFYNNVAVKNFHDLEIQKRRTDELVKSILPEYVASRIRDQESVIADWHKEATVLIATVGGFESLSKRVSAVHLVEILSDMFVKFDKLVKKYSVEKVNTLDTTYVVATGIDKEKEADHRAVASFALEALEVCNEYSTTMNHPLTFWAGISTGQVVSGVIGEARPCFDIWGDTVELANSMRDSAVDNSIVVNEPAYWRLHEHFDFAAIEGSQGNRLLLRIKSDHTREK